MQFPWNWTTKLALTLVLSVVLDGVSSLSGVSSLALGAEDTTSYLPISIQLDSNQAISLYQLHLEENPGRDLPKKKFRVRKVLQDTSVLQISTYSIAQNILAIMAGITRGTDAPQIGEIESQIDTQNEKDFLNLLVEMAQERRHAETKDEWEESINRFPGALARARFNAFLFATGFVEIIPPPKFRANPSVAPVTARYFVRLAQILEYATELNVNLAKLRFVQALSQLIFNNLTPSQHPPGPDQTTLRQMMVEFAAAELNPTSRGLLAPQLGLWLVNIHHLYRASTTVGLSESQMNQINQQKQRYLLKLISDLYPDLLSSSAPRQETPN